MTHTETDSHISDRQLFVFFVVRCGCALFVEFVERMQENGNKHKGTVWVSLVSVSRSLHGVHDASAFVPVSLTLPNRRLCAVHDGRSCCSYARNLHPPVHCRARHRHLRGGNTWHSHSGPSASIQRDLQFFCKFFSFSLSSKSLANSGYVL